MMGGIASLFGGGAAKAAVADQSFFDFEVKDIDGNLIKLDKFKDNVVLVVNVASACGFTPQYAELQKLYEQYQSRGFVVIGFPSNQFGNQESGTSCEIKAFATNKFAITFPLMDKVEVNGKDAAPVYTFLKQSKGELFGSNIKWNFSKFLVDRQGHVAHRYSPMTSPSSITGDIEKLLAAPPQGGGSKEAAKDAQPDL